MPPSTPETKKTSSGQAPVWIRTVLYIAGGHVFAAFLFLLFEIGDHYRH